MTYKKVGTTSCRDPRTPTITTESELAALTASKLFRLNFGNLTCDQAVEDCSKIMGISKGKARMLRDGHEGVKFADVIALLFHMRRDDAMLFIGSFVAGIKK